MAALARAIVHPRFETVEAERVSVAADVGVSGAKEAEAGLVTAVGVREPGRVVVAAAAAVRDELFEEHLLVHEIEHPQARISGCPRVIDHRQEPIVPDFTAAPGAGGGVERQLENTVAE